MGRLIQLHAKYADRATFVFVVIRDAGHPDPGTPAHEARLALDAPAESWLALIRDSLDHFAVPFTTLVDEDDEVERAFNAFPKRLVVLDSSGRITFDGSRGTGGGPSEWDLREVDRHIASLLAADR